MATWIEAQRAAGELRKAVGEAKDSLPQPLWQAFEKVGKVLEEGITSELQSVAPARQRGRKVPPLPRFTFPVSGFEVEIRRLSPFARDEIGYKVQKERKPPQPPKVVVEVGDAAVKVAEENYADPNYQQELQDYQVWMQRRIGELFLKLMCEYSVVCEIDPEALASARAMLAIVDPDVNDPESESYRSDKHVYVQQVLIQASQDLQELQMFVTSQSMPTEEAVQQHLDTFQNNVQGEAAVSA